MLRRIIFFNQEHNWKHHCCCSTHRPPIKWGCMVVHPNALCNIPRRTNLHTWYSSYWVLEISYHIPSITWKVMDAYKGEHLSNILVYEFEHITIKGRKCMLKVSFSQARVGFMNQWYGESPQFVTTECDIRCPSFRRRSQLPATYSIILQFILHYIMHL